MTHEACRWSCEHLGEGEGNGSSSNQQRLQGVGSLKLTTIDDMATTGVIVR